MFCVNCHAKPKGSNCLLFQVSSYCFLALHGSVGDGSHIISHTIYNNITTQTNYSIPTQIAPTTPTPLPPQITLDICQAYTEQCEVI